jgi:hypothetical protein
MEYGPWQGGHHAGSVRVQGGSLVIRLPQIQHSECFAHKGDLQAARLKAAERRIQLSIQHGLSKNMYRLVSNLETHEQWYEMALTQGKTMFFDIDDLPTATAHTWRTLKTLRTCYAHTMTNGKLKSFHSLLTSFKVVDHVDRDGLNNRRGNLRQSTSSENSRNQRQSVNNTSGRTGVLELSTGSYQAKWYDHVGSAHTKHFSLKKLGKREAFQQATALRVAMEKKYYTYVQAPDDDTCLVHQIPPAKTVRKPFACPHCAFRSAEQRSVNRHVNRKHAQ